MSQDQKQDATSKLETKEVQNLKQTKLKSKN
jgi:hypothetical protein